MRHQFASRRPDTDREFSANFDHRASATNSVLFLCLSPPKANRAFTCFVSFHRGATQSWRCSSFRSREEPHAGFATVAHGCPPRTILEGAPSRFHACPSVARVGVVGPEECSSLSSPQGISVGRTRPNVEAIQKHEESERARSVGKGDTDRCDIPGPDRRHPERPVEARRGKTEWLELRASGGRSDRSALRRTALEQFVAQRAKDGHDSVPTSNAYVAASKPKYC
jgi:hypothetical protein